jgi:hypothetical protein
VHGDTCCFVECEVSGVLLLIWGRLCVYVFFCGSDCPCRCTVSWER